MFRYYIQKGHTLSSLLALDPLERTFYCACFELDMEDLERAIMAKSINVLLSLKDQFTAPMKRLGDSAKDTERKMVAMKNKLSNFGNGINNKFLGIAGSIGKMGLAISGLGAFR